jgi:hypothetical protein
MILALAVALVLATVTPASALELWSAWGEQATLAPAPPAQGSVNVFTLHGRPRLIAIAVQDAIVAVGPVPGEPGGDVPAGLCTATVVIAELGFHLLRCRLPALLEEHQILTVFADQAVQVYRVTYGEWQSVIGLIRMWGLQRL